VLPHLCIMQQTLFKFLLWFSVFHLGVWVGGTLFHMIRAMAGKWLFADRLRFVAGTTGYGCLLKVFRS